MPGVGFMTNLMQSLYLQIAPENNKENQFIDFRLITTSKENHAFSLLVSNRTPGHAGRFLCARSGQARRRTLAQQRADAGHQVIETGIVHAQLAQRLLKRKQILGVGAERPAGGRSAGR